MSTGFAADHENLVPFGRNGVFLRGIKLAGSIDMVFQDKYERVPYLRLEEG
jgi:hypothetical protein